MATLNTLLVNGDSTNGPRNWTAQDYLTIDEGISAADGAEIACNTNPSGTTSEDTAFLLQNVNSDFGNMTALSYQIRYRVGGAQTNNRSLGIRIVKESDGTVLAAVNSAGDFQTVASNITTTTFVNSSVVAFSYVNTGASKADWDDARVTVRSTSVRNMGGDTNGLRVDTLQITGTYTAASSDRTISGSIAGLLPVVSGAIENTDPIYSISGSISGLLPTVSGDIEFAAPVIEISGSISGLLPQVTGELNNVVPIYELSGSVQGLLPVVSGAIENTAPIYEVSGSITGLLPNVSGELHNKIPVELSGSIAGLLPQVSGDIDVFEPAFNISGEIVGLLPTVSGSIDNIAPVYELSGSIIGLLPQVVGELDVVNPVYEVSGTIEGLLPQVSGDIDVSDPIYNLSGSISGLLPTVSGLVSVVNPVFELSGNITGLLPQVSGELFYGESVPIMISGNIYGLIPIVSGIIENESPAEFISGSEFNITFVESRFTGIKLGGLNDYQVSLPDDLVVSTTLSNVLELNIVLKESNNITVQL